MAYSFTEVLNSVFDPSTNGLRLAAGTGGRTSVSSADFSRPSNTTAYTVNDTVSNNATTTTPMTFTNAAGFEGGGGYITKVRLITDQSANVAEFRLWLFVSSPNVSADNAAFTHLWSNRLIEIGYIDIPALSTEGSGSDSAMGQHDTSRLAFVCAENSSDLYGVLEAKTAFTPASAQNFYVELTLEQS